MFGSQILDVGIGLIFLFLLLSLVCSSIKEGLESFLKFRAKDLQAGLREIFNDRDGSMLKKFYEHPLIFALFKGHYDPKDPGKLPSYIPSRTFAMTVIDLYKHEPDNPTLKRILDPLVHGVADETHRLHTQLEYLFNSSMDRVSGWYKRRTQKIIATLGFVVAFAFNVDSIAIARYLNVTPAGRAALIEQATKTAASTSHDSAAFQNLYTAVRVTDIPIGWTTTRNILDQEIAWRALPEDPMAWSLKFAGLFSTGLAISLGAPFWFDVLNKFMVVRSTVKPEEKSRDEPSKA